MGLGILRYRGVGWIALCEVTSGQWRHGHSSGELAFGPRSIIEILVAQTELSYGYTQPVTEERTTTFTTDMEIGLVTAQTPPGCSTPLCMTSASLENQEAKDADMARRRGAFGNLLKHEGDHEAS